MWWQDVVPSQPTRCEVTWRAAEDPLFKVGLFLFALHCLAACVCGKVLPGAVRGDLAHRRGPAVQGKQRFLQTEAQLV